MSIKKGLVGIPFVAVLVVAVFGAAQMLTAACWIFWQASEPTCAESEGEEGEFEYIENTKWISQNEGTWDLNHVMSIFPATNVENTSTAPDSTSVGCADWCSGTIEVTVTGNLVDPDEEGLGRLNAWQAITLHCSGSHDRTIKNRVIIASGIGG